MDKVFSLAKNRDLILVFIILGMSLLKLWKIDGGFILGEPDERNYLEVVRNLKFSPYPEFDGVPFYHSPPLFHYLGYLLSLFLSAKFLTIRLVSLTASIILSWTLYFYLKKKVSPMAGFISATLFTLIPISIYYSRIGLLEMLTGCFSLLFITFFDRSLDRKNITLNVFSGVFLGLAILTKYSALPLLLIIPLTFLTRESKVIFSQGLVPWIRNIRAKLPEILLFATPVVLGVLIPALSLLPIYLQNSTDFRWQFKYITSFGNQISFAGFSYYFQNLTSLLTLTMAPLLVVGLIVYLRKREFLVPAVSLAVLSYFVFKSSIFGPRYFFILVPLISLFAGMGLFSLFDYLRRVKRNYLASSLIFLSLLSMVPSSLTALRATHHQIIEEVSSFIKIKDLKGKRWVVSNYWPSAFRDYLGPKVTWLTIDESDAKSFSYDGRRYSDIEGNSLEVVLKEGGFVVIEDLYSSVISSDLKRTAAVSVIERNYQPIEEFEDHYPNWPYFNSRVNKIKVYQINPSVSGKIPEKN